MIIDTRFSRRLIVVALVTASCSQGDSGRPTSPSAAQDPTAVLANDVGLPVHSGLAFSPMGGEVGSSAVGDVKNGPIEILRVRVRPEGTIGFYAEPGETYLVNPDVPVEFWVEWKSDTPLATPPRLAMDWDFSESDNINCGSCLLNKSFPAGRHPVTIRMDDRVGGLTQRTFTIEAFRTKAECSALASGTVVAASLNAAGPLQLGRLNRNGIPSVCPSKVFPGLLNAATSYAYNTHTFTNSSGSPVCLTANFDVGTCGTNAHASAYLGSYSPTSQAAGYVGDVGSSVTQPFSFTVPGSAKFLIVVTNTASAATCNYQFSFNTAVCQ